MKRFLFITFGTLLGVILAVCLFVGGVFFYFSIGLPQVKSLKDYHPKTISYVYDRHGEVVAKFFDEYRIVVPLNRIPKRLVDAFISAEDARFYQHEAIDLRGILRAMIKNIEAGRIVQGGSTITQQVARSMLLTRRRTWSRKIREAILAYRMEHYLTKDEILTIYLNQLYLGDGAYGVEAAAQNYFGKHVWDLTLSECAVLAGLPKAPALYSPIKHPKRALERRRYVLNRLYENHYITREQMEKALAEPIHTVKPEVNPFFVKAPYYSEYVRQYVISKYGRDRLYSGGMKIYTYLDLSLQQSARKAIEMGLRALDKRQGYRGPIGHVALLPNQSGCQETVRNDSNTNVYEAGDICRAVIVQADKNMGTFHLCIDGEPGIITPQGYHWALKRPVFSKKMTTHEPQDIFKVLHRGDVIEVKLTFQKNGVWHCSLEEEPLAQAALFSMDVKTGEVLAMVGGYRFGENQFNRAIQSRRQPGSAFKPIIYAAALDKGLTAASIILDSPIVFRQFAQKTWKPENYEEHFYGPTTLRNGLVHSRNVVTVKILRAIGVPYVIKYAEKLGIKSKLYPNLSLALGSSALSLEELTSAYGVFARGGWTFKPLFIEKIVDRDGTILESTSPETNFTPGEKEAKDVSSAAEEHTGAQGPPKFEPRHVVSQQTSYILTNILEDVVRRGTGWRAKALKRPCAGKTGTTSNYRDAWFMGYTPQILTGVWVGFDNEFSLGQRETGSRAACPIWTRYMIDALKGLPVKEFEVPAGIVFVRIDPKTGLLARPGTPHAYLECFKEGTEPKRYAEKGTASNPIDFFQMDQ